MTKTFYVIRNKDAGAEYIDALLSAGYEEQPRIWHADFLLIECEHGGSNRDRIIEISRVKPAFMYPHVPYSYWLWDGPYPPAPVKCNFVVGQGAVMGMSAYGYPYRVEPVGWTGCPIKEFTPTNGTKLLFVPPHLVRDGKYADHEVVYPAVVKAAEFIARHRNSFESVTVNYSPNGIDESGVGALIKHNVTFRPVQGWYCTRCNHKIPEAQCSTLRVLYTGVCSKCANEYNGAIIMQFTPGQNTAQVEKYENNEHFDAILHSIS